MQTLIDQLQTQRNRFSALTVLLLQAIDWPVSCRRITESIDANLKGYYRVLVEAVMQR